MGTTITMLLITGVVLMIIGLLFKKPILYAFGASDETYPYADQYLSIYLLGTVFVMITMGMNSFINAQGFANKGMLTVMIGAVLNILLDPLFIFVLDMGVQGAAVATVISQSVSAAWVLKTLTSPKAVIPLRKRSLGVRPQLLKQILPLGMSGFVMGFTSSAVQIIANASLQQFGGDIYVGIMTVINSVREVISMPANGVTQAAQPILGFNYGAKKYERVQQGIKIMSVICIVYTTLMWGILLLIPDKFIQIFNNDPRLVELGVPALTTYFFGFFMMSLQMAGQSTYTGLGRAKNAIFFSIFRKVIIVIPLTLILPHVGGLGVMGVFLAEPGSNFIGGGACYITMLCTVWRDLNRKKAEKASGK